MMSYLTEEEKAKIIEEEKLRNEIRKKEEFDTFDLYYYAFLFLFLILPTFVIGVSLIINIG